MLRRSLLAGLAAGALLLTAAGCGDDPAGPGGDGRLSVVAAFYPLQFISERVGAETVAVTNLTQSGAEPHDLELKPSQVALVGDARLVVYLAGFQPAVDEAVQGEAKDTAFDIAAVEPLSDAPAGAEEEDEGGKPHANQGKDPHVWLDPLRLATVVDKLAERLAKLDPAHAEQFRTRADQLDSELHRLDEQYAEGLKNCARHEIVTSHAAFGYLAARYHLTQIPITGINPDEEPSPQRVSEVAKLAKEKGVTTIFFESLVSPKLSETMAKEVGAKAAVLDPIEGVRGQDNYFTVMLANLAALRDALGCT